MNRWVFNDKERVGAFVAHEVKQTAAWGGFNAIGVERDGNIIAGIVVNNYNGSNATVHIAVKHSLPRDFLPVCFDYLFNQCGLKRVTGLVPTDNPKALKFDKHIGFREEFVMKDGHPSGDMHVLVMFKDDCRWLAGASKND